MPRPRQDLDPNELGLSRSARYYRRHRDKRLTVRKARHKEAPHLSAGQRKRYYDSHREQERERARKYRENNPEKCSEMTRRYAQEHPEIYRAAANRRRAKKAAAGGDFSYADWERLCEMHDHRCACCEKRKQLHADHIVPLSRGGSNMIQNIQPLCKSCNSKKATATICYRPTIVWPTADASNAIIRIA